MVESLDCLQKAKAVQNTVWCIARMPLLGANCWSLVCSMLDVVWKPARKGRPVLEQGLLPLTWPVDCIAHKFISTAVPSLSLSSSYAVWARAAWKSAGFWLRLLPKLTLSKFCPVFSRIYLHRECKSRRWFILCWLSLNYLANSWILNTETFFLSYYFYSWIYEIFYFVNISLLIRSFVLFSFTWCTHSWAAQPARVPVLHGIFPNVLFTCLSFLHFLSKENIWITLGLNKTNPSWHPYNKEKYPWSSKCEFRIIGKL